MSLLSFFSSPSAIDLARSQFAFVISFHIIFPAFSIGLAAFLVILEGGYLLTKNPVYMHVYNYWLKIFAVVFGIGVVSGLVMAFEVGANWANYSDKVGPILGPLLSYETLTAFFLEAGFLGVMLFGAKKVGYKIHFMATVLVSTGTLISATWILAANSWMQTPVGFTISSNGQFIPTDWLAIIFSPSAPYRWVHMIFASLLSTSLMVAGVGGYHLLKDKKNSISRVFFSMALWMVLIVAPLQIIAGDIQGENTLQYQPAKIAGMEGDFKTGVQALHLFGVPDVKDGKLLYDVSIPHLGSVILTHHWNGVVKGLDSFPKDQLPVVSVEFFSFRIMVAIGFGLATLGLMSLVLRFKNALYDKNWFKYLTIIMAPTGFIALLMGWVTTETGRQPWTVYGYLTTASSVSPVSLGEVISSFAVVIFVYMIVFGSGIFYVFKMMKKMPNTEIDEHGH